MQGTYIPETNYVPREHGVAAILLFLFMVLISLLLLLLLLLLSSLSSSSSSEFLNSQLWLGNIHLSWDVVINRIRLPGLVRSLKSFLQLNMCQELQIFAAVYMYWGAS